MIHRRSPIRSLAALALFGLTLAGVRPASAQLQAFIEIKSGPDVQDPHPVDYFWDGEQVFPTRESVQYYHFFYTGTVSPDATVPRGSEIRRIAIPLGEWEIMRGAIIARLTSYYEEAYNITQAEGPTSGVTFNNAATPAASGGGARGAGTPGQPGEVNAGALDPVAAAEWTFYYDQMVLWQFYCRRVVLNDVDATRANSSREALQLAADREALVGFDGLNVDAALAAAKALSDYQLDPDGEETEEEAGEELGPDGEAAPEPATIFDPDADYADRNNNNIFREEFVRLAEEREKKAIASYTEMLARIDKRREDQGKYEDWLSDRRIRLREFSGAWSKVREGNSVYIDDTFYLISKDPPGVLPHGSLAVPVREQVTPYDLIDRGGSLKKPVER